VEYFPSRHFDLAGRRARSSEPATEEGLKADRRILYFLTYLSGRRVQSEPATADGLTTDRRILYFLTLMLMYGLSEPSVKRSVKYVIEAINNEEEWEAMYPIVKRDCL
jgi:hypothetical protein